METKKITLRSQTVQCPHCGEYYSVTYKYCPFCDAGRQEEERKLAEKKKKKQAFFGNLFGSHEPEKKKKQAKNPDQVELDSAHAERPLREKGHRETGSREPAMSREQVEEAHAPKDSGQKEHAGKEPVRKKEPTRRHGARKKTSEMTEEEKAAHLAEREARAAARKRERDRLAREAALAAAETVEAQKAPAEAPAQVEVPTVEAGPVFEEVTVPETFGFAEPPLVETDPAAFVQAPVSAEGPVVKTEPTPGESQEIPVFAPGAEADQAPEEESAKTQWDTLKDLETLSQDADGSAPAIPVMPQAEHTEVQVGEAVPAAPVQETKAPAGEETAAPQEEVPAEKPVETEEDLDALLSEIRDLLADSPVPKLDPEQLKKPPQPVPEVSIPDAAPVPPAVEEPTIPMGEIPAQEIGQDAGQAPAEQVPASVFDEQPTQVIPTQEIAEEMQAQEEAAPQEELLAAVRPPRERAPRERAAARKPEKKTKKKGGPNVALILLSLVIVAAAAFIVVRNVVPAFQDGILGGGEPKAAEGLTLDRTALDLAEAGTTMALVPTFSPEGATAQLTWTSSKPEVATVDEKGTVTAVAPGTTVITASMENGQKAECTVNCTWSADAPSQEPAGTEPAANGADAPAETKPTLSANDITLDSEGDTQQITVTGASGEVTFTSSDTKIATVTADGTITAVAPGRATVTAKVGDQTLNCAVRCIW